MQPDESRRIVREASHQGRFCGMPHITAGCRSLLSHPDAKLGPLLILFSNWNFQSPQKRGGSYLKGVPQDWQMQHHWLRVTVGCVVSIVVGDLVISTLIGWLWSGLEKHHYITRAEHTFTRQLGWLERALYTSALLAGAWQWIGVWLAIKVAARWRSTSGDTEAPVDKCVADWHGAFCSVWLCWGLDCSLALTIFGQIIVRGSRS